MKKKSFKQLLEKYLNVKGLEIIVILEDGSEIELFKNRTLVNNEILTHDNSNNRQRIALSDIKTVDMYAA